MSNYQQQMVPRFIIDVQGRVWKRENGEMKLLDINQVFKPRCPVLHKLTLTEDGQLFDLANCTPVKSLTNHRFKRLDPLNDFDISLIDEDDGAVIYSCLKSEKVYSFKESSIHRVVSYFRNFPTGILAGIVFIGTDGRLRSIWIDLEEDKTVGDLGLTVNLDEIVEVTGRYIICKNHIHQIDRQADFTHQVNTEGYPDSPPFVAAISIANHLTLIFQDGIVYQPYFDMRSFDKCLSDELDDGTNWKEFFPINDRNYVGVINQSGKAYTLGSNLAVKRLDIPREIFIKPSTTKNARNVCSMNKRSEFENANNKA